jgi:hypothetical protein
MLQAARRDFVHFGIIADVHHGLMPDAHERLRRFLAAASTRQLDFIIQLGDFCHPRPESREFLATWHSYRGVRHNVLGNHDMDFGTKNRIMDLWGMEKNYYSFDAGGFHFVILDCNFIKQGTSFIPYADGNYASHGDDTGWPDPEQSEWLRADLAAAPLPTMVFTHQSVAGYWTFGNPKPRTSIRETLAGANRTSGRQTVVACFSGHEHADSHGQQDGVNYLLVNSASYYWVGEQYGGLAKYRNPLFTFVTADSESIRVEGRRGEFVPPSPATLRHPSGPYATASIRSRKINIQPRA